MNTTRFLTVTVALLYCFFWIAVAGAAVYLFVLVVRALKKYINTKEIREEKKSIRKSLGEVLKENRLRCKMTQEFVSETLGVSRQAVSKWENGTKHLKLDCYCRIIWRIFWGTIKKYKCWLPKKFQRKKVRTI